MYAGIATPSPAEKKKKEKKRGKKNYLCPWCWVGGWHAATAKQNYQKSERAIFMHYLHILYAPGMRFVLSVY